MPNRGVAPRFITIIKRRRQLDKSPESKAGLTGPGDARRLRPHLAPHPSATKETAPDGGLAVDVDRSGTAVAVRAWNAWRDRGMRYVAHKALRRSLGRWPGWKRRLVYADPRAYWTLRGGPDFFREQEDHPARSLRSAWLADRIATYRPASILEVGCGYGKQLGLLRDRLPDVPLFGIDFSPTQLDQARRHLRGMSGIGIALATGLRLPFPDRAFDLVLTSAVILHNPPPEAERIRREVVRVSRRLAAHNEDTNVSYNRFGYDTAAWYHAEGIPVLESGPIQVDADPDRGHSQFCVAEPWRP
jgi:SAM-dependent methyltransferase